MVAKYWIIGFIVLIGFGGWFGQSNMYRSHSGPPMEIVRVERDGSGFRMNVEFPADKTSKVTCIDGVDVVIERADGREFRVSGPISLDAALNPVDNVNFTPADCPSALSDGDRFRLRWRLGVHHYARLRWFTRHLSRQWLPSGEWFYDHTEDSQLVISEWFTFIDKP
jgi:hypothetical protein